MVVNLDGHFPHVMVEAPNSGEWFPRTKTLVI